MTEKPKSDKIIYLCGTEQAVRPLVVSTKILLISFTLLWVCGILCPVAGAETINEDYDGFSKEVKQHAKSLREFKKGKLFFEEESYDLARKQILLALQLDNEHLEARYYLGLVESRCGAHKLALGHFMFIYKKKPHFKKLSFETASSHLALGNCAEARTWLDRYLKTESDSKETKSLGKEIKNCLKREEKRGGQQ
jgi:tetratricopeptide (TPR) repeat protein